MTPTVADLGQKVKAKYPGQYDDLDDAEVGKRVKAKFPGAYDDFADAPPSQQAAAPPAPESIGQTIYRTSGLQGAVEAAKGVGQGALRTAIGIDTAARKIPGVGKAYSAAAPVSAEDVNALRPATVAQNPAQTLGQTAEQAAEFFAPTGAIGAGTKLLSKAPTAARLLGRAVLEGVGAGTVAGAQSGGDPEAMKTAALTAGGASAVLGGAGAVLSSPTTKKVATEALGLTTGAGGESVRTALDNPTPELLSAMRGGTNELDILNSFKDALQNVKNQRGAAYRAALSQIPQTPQNIAPIRQEMLAALKDHGIAVTRQGLDFSRSTIPDAGAQKEVNGIVQDIMNWGSKPGDNTPLGLDTLKRRIDDFWSPSSNARAFVQRLKDTTRSVLNQVPGYQDMTKDYAEASKFITQVDSELSLNAKNPGTAIRKLTYALKQNNNYRQILTDALSQYTATDLKGELAGYALSKATPRGLMGPATGAGILGAIATGHLTPAAAVAMATSSPRLMGELMVAIARNKPGLKAAGAAVGAVAPKLGAAAIMPPPGTQP